MKYWVGLWLSFFLISCSLSKDERAIAGYWKQSMFIFESVKHFKSDKTYEVLFYTIGDKRIFAYTTGKWKVMDDRLVTELTEGPVIRTESNDSSLDGFLNSLGFNDLESTQSKKIASKDQENIVFETSGLDEIWKRMSGDVFASEMQRFRAAQKKQ